MKAIRYNGDAHGGRVVIFLERAIACMSFSHRALGLTGLSIDLTDSPALVDTSRNFTYPAGANASFERSVVAL